MRLVKVYGQLAKRLGQKVFRVSVASPAEAVRFLCANFPGLEQWLIDSEQDGIGYRVKVSKTSVGMDDLAMFCNEEATISITPVLAGAGSGTGKILAGIGLVAISFLLPGAGLFGATSVFGATAAGAGAGFAAVAGTALGTAFSAIGASLVLGGTAQLISPKAPAIGAFSTGAGALGTQSAISDPRRLQSFNFNGIQNTSTQGTPLPVVYGKAYVGSVTLSVGVYNSTSKA